MLYPFKLTSISLYFFTKGRIFFFLWLFVAISFVIVFPYNPNSIKQKDNYQKANLINQKPLIDWIFNSLHCTNINVTQQLNPKCVEQRKIALISFCKKITPTFHLLWIINGESYQAAKPWFICHFFVVAWHSRLRCTLDYNFKTYSKT